MKKCVCVACIFMMGFLLAGSGMGQDVSSDPVNGGRELTGREHQERGRNVERAAGKASAVHVPGSGKGEEPDLKESGPGGPSNAGGKMKAALDAASDGGGIQKPGGPAVSEKGDAGKGDAKNSEKDPELPEGTGSKASERSEGGETKEPLDRPWIIKGKTEEGPGESRKEPAEVKWESRDQKVRCQAHLEKVRENFLQARYYSIQGDSCSTADHARAFQTWVNRCKEECPEGFLEKNQYTERIINNLNTLYTLGTERCNR